MARINVRGAKLQFIDQDAEVNQEIKPILSISSWLALPPEKFIALIFVLVILSFLIYVLFGSFSRVLVRFGNAEFSAGNEKLGTTAYYLALEFNRDLKTEIEQCYAENSQQHYEQAISHCNKAIEVDNNFATAYFRRGYAYLKLKQYDQAIADFTKDIEIIPVATRSYINLGSIYMEQGKFDLAISNFTKSIEINPKEPQAWLNRGLTYFQQNKNDFAVSDCAKAVELEGKYWNAYFCLGLAFSNQEKYELAINNFDKALEFVPSTNASILYCMKGATYTKMDSFDLAITSLEQGVKFSGSNENDWCKSALENARQGIPTQ